MLNSFGNYLIINNNNNNSPEKDLVNTWKEKAINKIIVFYLELSLLINNSYRSLLLN